MGEYCETVSQTISAIGQSICPGCVHRPVCRAIDNQPCIECSQYIPSPIYLSDVVHITRCRGCIYGKHKHQDQTDCYYDDLPTPHEPEFFCGYGERRERNDA